MPDVPSPTYAVIVDLLVKQINGNLAAKQIHIKLHEDAARYILEKTCQDRSYGARPLRRALQKYIEDPLSEALIQGTITTRPAFIEVYLEDYHVVPYHPGLQYFVDPGNYQWGFGERWSCQVLGIKDEFRIEQTMIRASGNNPLKFSLDDDDAMNTLLGLGRRGSMAPK